MYLQRSLENRHQLVAKIEQETALANERQMEFQHRLYKPQQNIELDDGKDRIRIRITRFSCNRFMSTCCFHAFSIGKYNQSKSLSILSSYW